MLDVFLEIVSFLIESIIFSSYKFKNTFYFEVINEKIVMICLYDIFFQTRRNV